MKFRLRIVVLACASILWGCGDDVATGGESPIVDAGAHRVAADAESGVDANPDVGLEANADVDADAAEAPVQGADATEFDAMQPDAALPASLVLPSSVAIPYVVAGAGGATAIVVASNPGQQPLTGIVWHLDGSPRLHLDAPPPDSIAAGGSVSLTLSYDGSAIEEITSAVLSASCGSASAASTLWAVAGDPGLGPSTWTPVIGAGGFACGQGATLSMPTAPFPDGSGPWTDDSVRVFIPESYRDLEAQDLIVHFHGWSTTLDETLTAHRYQEHLCASGANGILVVPQGPVNAQSGNFGKLMTPGGFKAFVNQVLVLGYREGKLTRPALGDLVLTSHSGGYQAVAANLADNSVPPMLALLFDSLYGNVADYEAFVVAGGRLVSNYTAGGGTDGTNQAFATTLSAAGINVSAKASERALRDAQAVISFADTTHGGSTRIDGAYGEALRFGMRHHRHGPRIELRQATVLGGTATVTWLSPVDTALQGFVVESSQDGITWQSRAQVDADQASATFPFAGGARVRVMPVVQGISGTDVVPSDTGWLGAAAKVLIVDGFDRVLGGSYGGLQHSFAAQVGEATAGATSISHRALLEDGFSLAAFPTVIWLLGDESSDDMTLSPEEQAIATDYVAGGGRLVVSGSEVAWDLGLQGAGTTFLTTVLGASLDQDDSGAGTAMGTGALSTLGPFSFVAAGKPYVEDYPDSLLAESGAQALLLYDGSGQIAAVGTPGKSVLVGFPIELLDPPSLSILAQALVTFVQ
jgi:hypothetical protein